MRFVIVGRLAAGNMRPISRRSHRNGRGLSDGRYAAARWTEPTHQGRVQVGECDDLRSLTR